MSVINNYQGRECNSIFERTFEPQLGEDIPNHLKCICDDPSCVADWIVLSRRLRTRSCSTLSPFIYFENSSGEISFAGSSSDPTPAGYNRHEITTLHELENFERRVRTKDHDTFKRNRETQAELWNEYVSAQRRQTDEELRNGNFTFYGEDEDGNPVQNVLHIEEADESAPGGGHNRELLKAMLSRARSHVDRKSRFDAREPASYLTILHYDEDRALRFRQ